VLFADDVIVRVFSLYIIYLTYSLCTKTIPNVSHLSYLEECLRDKKQQIGSIVIIMILLYSFH
jgi:hypothetical protein